MADEAVPVTLDSLRPWVLWGWAALGGVGTAVLFRWLVPAPFEATDWFGRASVVFAGIAFLALASGFTALPLVVLATRAGRPPGPWTPRLLAVPAMLVCVVWTGLLVDRAVAMHDADRRFASLLGPRDAVEHAEGCAPVGGRGVVLTCDRASVHPAHAGLPWSLRASGPDDAAWIAVVCRSTRPSVSYRSQHVVPDDSLVTRAVIGARVSIQGRSGEALASVTLEPEVPGQVRSDVLTLTGDFRIAPWTVGAGIGRCVTNQAVPSSPGGVDPH